MSAEAATTTPLGPRRAGYSLLDRGALAVAVIVVAMVAPVFVWAYLAPNDLPLGPAHFELLMLAASAVLTIVIVIIQIFVHIYEYGGATVRGNRDNYPLVSGLPGRLTRAHANAVENLTPFAVLIFVTQFFHSSNRWTASASALFLAARIVHVITYSAGVTIVRSAAFYSGVIAIVIIALQLPWLLF